MTTKPTSSSIVYEHIRRDIVRCVLKPGQKLPIDDLCQRYGIGLNPVREALNRLTSEHLVDRKDQRGFFVPPLTDDGIVELVKTRCLLERLALEEAVKNRTMEWEETLVVAFHRLSRTPRSTDSETFSINPEWESRHHDFHAALIGACGSTWLQKFCADLRVQAERYRYLSDAHGGFKRDVDAEHRAVMELALAGRVAEAGDALEAHFRSTLDHVLPSVEPERRTAAATTG